MYERGRVVFPKPLPFWVPPPKFLRQRHFSSGSDVEVPQEDGLNVSWRIIFFPGLKPDSVTDRIDASPYRFQTGCSRLLVGFRAATGRSVFPVLSGWRGRDVRASLRWSRRLKSETDPKPAMQIWEIKNKIQKCKLSAYDQITLLSAHINQLKWGSWWTHQNFRLTLIIKLFGKCSGQNCVCLFEYKTSEGYYCH